MEELEDRARLFTQGLLPKPSDLSCMMRYSNTEKGVIIPKTFMESTSLDKKEERDDKVCCKVYVDLILQMIRLFDGPSSWKNSLLTVNQAKHGVG